MARDSQNMRPPRVIAQGCKIEVCTVTQEFPSLYQIETQLRVALEAPLPGPNAHLPLAPRPRRGWHPGQVRPGALTAAGLVLLYPLRDQPHVLLTVRAGALAQHAGQVSFPGGKLEEDETVSHAALREAAEEVGVNPDEVRLLGGLSTLYIPVSNFALHPVLGIANQRPLFRPDEAEVRRLLEAPVRVLLDSAGPRRGMRWRGDEQVQVPYFEVCEERVWGATAMILAELLAMLGVSPVDPWG